MELRLSDYDYDIPEGLIAQKPASPRDSSRMMVVCNSDYGNDDIFVEHRKFSDIVGYMDDGDVLVINETKVMASKIIGKKLTGSPAELIVEEIGRDIKGRVSKNVCRCRIKTKNPIPGTKLVFSKYHAEVIDKDDDIFYVKFDEEVDNILKKIGILPTPPYIKRKIDRKEQYQTVYSNKKGSVAAPTAGLHFTGRVMNKLKKKGVKIAKVCLHVGFGTFLPVRDLKDHKMHSEYFEIDKKNADIINNRKGRLFVVGTTAVRTLESVADNKGRVCVKKGVTDIFIKPGYKFKTNIDCMITNFHLPRSTLLMLVSAFLGREAMIDAYKLAVKKKYRFFSFGDAMLLVKNKKIFKS